MQSLIIIAGNVIEICDILTGAVISVRASGHLEIKRVYVPDLLIGGETVYGG